MERTVPTTESEEVELYLRTYYSLLRSTTEVRILTLEEAHTSMNSLLHPSARDPNPDMAAFIYSVLRLPAEIIFSNLVVMGQSAEVFCQAGYGDVSTWKQVSAPARRRRCYYDGGEILACVIASRSDIDDVIPMLTAYQIEWNKINRRLQRLPSNFSVEALYESSSGLRTLADILEIPMEDIDRLSAIWDADTARNLQRIADQPCDLRMRLLSGSLSDYRRATHAWWENINRSAPQLKDRPVYFISSNTHSVLNLLTGFALQHETQLIQYLQEPGNAGLLNEWNDIQAKRISANPQNFLYYVYKKYQQTPAGKELNSQQAEYELACGITRVPSENYFDVEAQIFELSALKHAYLDPRIQDGQAVDILDELANSDALILNIDYPLGLGAYNILSEVAEHVGEVLGVYVMGKAATLNGVVGDVMIPAVVHDEHSQNTFLFSNCFTASDVAKYLVYGTVLDNQKAVTVQGTFLQNARYMDVFYREGYTDIEMEAGPYLSCVYEMYRPKRHPTNEIVNLYGLPFDLGLIHYASDTPLSKGKNLGAGNLSYFGMDSTYAVSTAILRRVLQRERKRLRLNSG
jgi:hypothetical protein